MKITNSRVGDIPDPPTQFHFSVRALTQQEIASAVANDASSLGVIAEKQLQAHLVPGTPLRRADIVVPSKGVDCIVISFPKMSVVPGHAICDGSLSLYRS
jgi:hypothetical protein